MNTRRTFLKKSLLAAAAGISTSSLSLAATAREKTNRHASPAKIGDTLQTDIIVCGAGPAGIPAAIAAARNGARVVLIEQDNAIGGAPVNMFVSYLCGGPKLGIFTELINTLNNEFNLTGKPHPGGVAREAWFHPAHFANVLSRMVRAEKNITLLAGAQVTGAITDSSGNTPKMLGVEVSRSNGKILQVTAPITIDATGTGVVSELAGADVMYGRESRDKFNESFAPAADKNPHFVMPCTLMFLAQRFRPGPPLDALSFKRGSGIESNLGWIKPNIEEFKKRNTGTYLYWGRTIPRVDTRDSIALGNAYQLAISQLNEDVGRFFDQGFLVTPAPRIGVRECRRIVGDYIITQNDLQSAKMPDDVISLGNYALDIWGNSELAESDKRLPMYGIPLRSTIAKGIDGLLLAGKNLSASHIAMGAIRVQPLVAAAGEGTGTAAALAIKNKTTVRNINIRSLQKLLLKNGTLTPQYSPVS